MPLPASRLSRVIFVAALGACLVHPHAALAADATPAPAAAEVVEAAARSPADFLDAVARSTKARWRLLFRPPPPTPPTDRGRTALILGTLLGDGFLILQAGDAQQFRNNNQDVLAYCRTLGLGEKLLPRLMTQGNLAEKNEWKELREEMVGSHQEALRLLREQMDEDIALLIDIGLGLRMLEIVSAIMSNAPDEDLRPLCGSSPRLLCALRSDFQRITASRREEALLLRVGAAIAEASSDWRAAEKTPLSQDQAAASNDKLRLLMQELVDKPAAPRPPPAGT